MTNVSATAEKVARRGDLFQIAIDALKNDGWAVERIARAGKSSVRRITKGPVSKVATIRTSQDARFAFTRNAANDGWGTLEGADCVVVSSVDDPPSPQFALVHMFDGNEVREHFDRSYAARQAANYTLPLDRGIWLYLFEREAAHPAIYVGAGLGLKHPPIARVPLNAERASSLSLISPSTYEIGAADDAEPEEAPLTIAEAKRRLAKTLGVDAANIKLRSKLKAVVSGASKRHLSIFPG